MIQEETPRHSVSVAAAIVNDAGQVLAIRRRDNSRWEPPGGVLELDETIEDGLRREVREETGLEIEIERLTGIYKNMPRGIIALVFCCRPAAGSLRLGEETLDASWLSPAQLAERMAPAYAIRLLDAIRQGPALIRSHDGIDLLSTDGGSDTTRADAPSPGGG